ncbi:Indoleamine 2,3-dioxygenase 1 [Ceratocystis fimbriata CBS 114723]|uniref:Indoleamine 2,3-dioxygenase 1 n=1 Tax=Ceratocystis fimbriata CBS 114723 TaxID=1035309 RepID=A0A2C5WTS4_9PEZI|nr:Indoleamine 2,3-dioxygenase 1 [Ceratocystis fimbriata CBS 114723]
MAIQNIPFEVLADAKPHDRSLPAFMVSTTRGFLPRMDPIVQLPAEFAPLERILEEMPVKKLDGSPGLLASSKLGDAVKDFPDLSDKIELYKEDVPMMNALYRDYSFLASAYLLEPCHERFVRGEEYGLARDFLPRQISMPIKRCSELSGFMPWMEYAGSYALFNYRLEDPKAGMEYDNLRLIRAFEHGLDPTSSEAGFVLVHIEMVKNSGPLVASTMEALDALKPGASHATELAKRVAFNKGMEGQVTALTKINAVMEMMWQKSLPRKYTSFRTFIFGITSQSMFPNGVVYEGVNDDKPMAFRGESGANDSMVPLMDNFLQLPLPETPLTEILKDFRKYRPSNHREFLLWVRNESEGLDLKDYALSVDASPESDEEKQALKTSRSLWLQLLNQVRDFRWRHWCFAREYILKQTSHPTATGGSPIVTWLPNQLQAVMDEMEAIYKSVHGSSGEWALGEVVVDIMEKVERQNDTLKKEVAKFCAERGVDKN